VENEAIQVILEDLSVIEQDMAIPKNIRQRIKNAMNFLGGGGEGNVQLQIGKSIEELGDVADDPNIPAYTKMQIWSVVSQLEQK